MCSSTGLCTTHRMLFSRDQARWLRAVFSFLGCIQTAAGHSSALNSAVAHTMSFASQHTVHHSCAHMRRYIPEYRHLISTTLASLWSPRLTFALASVHRYATELLSPSYVCRSAPACSEPAAQVPCCQHKHSRVYTQQAPALQHTHCRNRCPCTEAGPELCCTHLTELSCHPCRLAGTTTHVAGQRHPLLGRWGQLWRQ